MKIYTIGFTQKSAEQFFGLLNQSNISRLIDVRLNNVSQLAGFAKRNDLRFFLRELCGAEYLHLPDLAPTDAMLSAYKGKEISWDMYEDKFLNLMAQRNIERTIDTDTINNSCLLCSEHKPHYCHRRLVAEYLNEKLNADISIQHLF